MAELLGYDELLNAYWKLGEQLAEAHKIINNYQLLADDNKRVGEKLKKRMDELNAELKQAQERIAELEGALKQVVANWEYQKKTGGKYFTSAPTEMERKADSRDKTRKMVGAALQRKKDAG